MKDTNISLVWGVYYLIIAVCAGWCAKEVSSVVAVYMLVGGAGCFATLSGYKIGGYILYRKHRKCDLATVKTSNSINKPDEV